MHINYTHKAFNSLIKLVNFIERENTKGAGERWLTQFEDFLHKKLMLAKQTKLCNNLTFEKLQLRCIYYNDWVIAFSLNGEDVLIEAFLHRSRIID